MSTTPVRQLLVTFDRALPDKQLADIRNNLSAVVSAGGHLWLGGDEGTFLDRLTPDSTGTAFGQHRRFDLASILTLPAAASKTEIDIEGIDFDSGFLWVIGSHSLKRKKADPSEAPAKNRQHLAKIETELNRHTLARIPLDGEGQLVAQTGTLRAARLESDETGDALFHALLNDGMLSPFCTIPSKDNGLDIEGLAVRGNRVFAGLRGPVLRGWAVVLELECKDAQAQGSLALARPVKKHFLQLEGLGVRDLTIRGTDLFILAGPTMDLDGPSFVFRWAKALEASDEALLFRKELTKVLKVPHGQGADHAEGIALLSPGEALICYDSPAGARLVEGHPEQVRLDVFELSGKDIDSTAGPIGIS